jgi:menaquinone-dependent protoporphyrinogen oxidase
MRILVGAASRHGSTEEIASEIGKALRAALPGAEVDVIPLDRLATLEPYDVVVLGSAVYMGRWLDLARQLVSRHAETLSARQVYLFSSGPVGEPPKPDEEPADVAELVRLSGARDHRVFPGHIDRRELGFAERAVVRAVHGAEGDFRDWPAVREWAAGIAADLRAHASRTAT